MNLIICNKNCTHQQDGYCKLESQAFLSSAKVGECCYYQKAVDSSFSNTAPNRKKAGKQ